MAKGDREILKADTDDGYTKIANLLLEALAMAKLNGVQKGICLFLWRRTYGWGKTDDAISLREFSEACGTSESYISRQIKHLVSLRVIIRVSHEAGKTPVYTFNTKIAEWDSSVLIPGQLHDCDQKGLYNHSGVTQTDKGLTNVQPLHDSTSQPFNKCARVPFNKCARVNQDSALEPRGIEGPLKKIERHTKEIYTPPKSPPKGGARKTDPRIKQVIDYYHDRFVEKFGEKPVIDGPKDGAIIKKLLAVHDLDKLLWLIKLFFDSKDPWIQNSGYTIGVFKTQVNKLLVQAKSLGGGNGGRAGPPEKDTNADDFFIN